jgi:FMN phosphatase YigB (HAD superfamily)
MIKAIFFDAVGTLFYLTKTVGDHYAFVGEDVGLKLNAKKLDAAFYSAWKQMPPRAAIDGPRENDDKDWWRELADLVLEEAAPAIDELDRAFRRGGRMGVVSRGRRRPPAIATAL